LNPSGLLMYISHSMGVTQVCLVCGNLEPLLIVKKGEKHNDGNLEYSAVKSVEHFLFFDNYNFLLADTGNNLIRVVNLRDSTISSLCRPHPYSLTEQSGNISTCKLRFPIHLLNAEHLNGVIIMGIESFYMLNYGENIMNLTLKIAYKLPYRIIENHVQKQVI